MQKLSSKIFKTIFILSTLYLLLSTIYMVKNPEISSSIKRQITEKINKTIEFCNSSPTLDTYYSENVDNCSTDCTEETINQIQKMSTTLSTVRVVHGILEVTPDFTNIFPSQQDASQYLTNLYNMTSKITRRDFNIEIFIDEIIFSNNPTWKQNCTDNNNDGLINGTDYAGCFITHWGGIPISAYPRDFVVWIHKDLSNPAGSFFIGENCTQQARGHTALEGTMFQQKLSHIAYDMDLRITAHEIGHNFGGVHTYNPNYSKYNCSWNIVEPFGVCNSQSSFSVMGSCTPVYLGFAPETINLVNCFTTNRFSCAESININIQGDYNHDGILNDNDILDCKTCAKYQIQSNGCKQVFDFNSDQLVTLCDCDILKYQITGQMNDCNNNSTHDACESNITDCNLNGVPDSCDLLTLDCNSNNMIDQCESLTSPNQILITSAGCRYLEVEFPQKLCSDLLCIRVRVDSASSVSYYFVQSSGVISKIPPVFKTAKDWSKIRIYGQQIKPDTIYLVEVFKDNGELVYSNAPKTYKWGDVTKDNTVDVNDYNCASQAFSGIFNCSLYATDIDPSVPNQIINIDDLMRVVEALYGYPYPY